MPVPPMTVEQRADALAKAAGVRTERARLRRALKEGRIAFADVLADADSPLQGATVDYVLRSLPRIGGSTAAEIMAEVGISENRRLRGLGSRQRAKLAARLS